MNKQQLQQRIDYLKDQLIRASSISVKIRIKQERDTLVDKKEWLERLESSTVSENNINDIPF